MLDLNNIHTMESKTTREEVIRYIQAKSQQVSKQIRMDDPKKSLEVLDAHDRELNEILKLVTKNLEDNKYTRELLEDNLKRREESKSL